jgi:hypothetical protein
MAPALCRRSAPGRYDGASLVSDDAMTDDVVTDEAKTGDAMSRPVMSRHCAPEDAGEAPVMKGRGR